MHDFFLSWGGALAYTCQLYFDFSGYSDMAICAARCFGVRFPMNFASPYKATSIIDFWRRWHMTLSRFRRDYLYFALGGNRHGKTRRFANLLITMLLGGLWHGANWTFIAWADCTGSTS
jgi:D-alanyl-lipoteichoic acid acyltransferase DltB (MBOAT superfamily)